MSAFDLFRLSLSALWSNKLRSSLTLVGVILGVSSIIAVMTALTIVQQTMEEEMSVLGSQVFQLQKWPAGFSSEEERIEAMRWPAITVEDANDIRANIEEVDLVGAELWDFGNKVSFRGEGTNANVVTCGCTPEYPENNSHHVLLGRNISEADLKRANRVVVLGHAIAEEIFPFIDPIGQRILLNGREFEVIGVFDAKSSAFGGGYDNYTIIPITAFTQIWGNLDRGGFERSVNVTVRARTPDLLPQAIEKTRLFMRAKRKLGPRDADNFTYFTSDSMINQFNDMTRNIKVGAFVIGTVALIVAGVGIMNIMLVSVTERTREIGIRKAIGARQGNILGQFLIEAILLCNLGGLLGIALGFGLGNLLALLGGFVVAIPMFWAVMGMVFCTTVGVAFGFYPALKAARLKPVESLRFE